MTECLVFSSLCLSFLVIGVVACISMASGDIIERFKALANSDTAMDTLLGMYKEFFGLEDFTKPIVLKREDVIGGLSRISNELLNCEPRDGMDKDQLKLLVNSMDFNEILNQVDVMHNTEDPPSSPSDVDSVMLASSVMCILEACGSSMGIDKEFLPVIELVSVTFSTCEECRRSMGSWSITLPVLKNLFEDEGEREEMIQGLGCSSIEQVMEKLDLDGDGILHPGEMWPLIRFLVEKSGMMTSSSSSGSDSDSETD